jgi:hypothetical protein
MQTVNQKSNVFQSIFGIFLQSAHAPQKVIDTLSRMGICVSVDSINTAVVLLSREAHRGMSALGKTLLASYAYDNFDVDLKSTVHTLEKSEDTLKHLTASLLYTSRLVLLESSVGNISTQSTSQSYGHVMGKERIEGSACLAS